MNATISFIANQSYKNHLTRFLSVLALFAIVASSANAQGLSKYDAKAVSIDSPQTSPICAGRQDLYVTFANEGTAIINQIQYTLFKDGRQHANGTVQVQLDKKGGSKAFSSDTSVLLASPKFNQGSNDLKVRVDQVNGHKDTVNRNNTLRKTLKTGLKGTYTVGGSKPDFKGFENAIRALKDRGVCGPVDMNIRAGRYTKRDMSGFSLSGIKGLSRRNTLNFKGDGKDKTAIIANTSGGFIGRAAPTIQINQLTNIEFKDLEVTNKGEGDAIHANNVSNLTINRCKLFVPNQISGFSTAHCLDLEPGKSITVKNSHFSAGDGASYAIRTQSGSNDVRFFNNLFSNWSGAGIFTAGTSTIHILNNRFNDTTGSVIGDAAIRISSRRQALKLTIKDNVIEAANQEGITVEEFKDVTIKNNTVKRWGDVGIEVKNVTNTTIDSNRLKLNGKSAGNATGLTAANSSNVDIGGNLVDSATGQSLFLSNLDGSDIQQNTVKRAFGAGIGLKSGDNLQIANNMVTHKGDDKAINLTAGRNIDFLHNSVLSDSGRYVIVNGSNQVAIKNNNLKGGSKACISATKGSSATFNGNNYDHPSTIYQNGNTQYATLQIWQVADPQQNSVAWSQPAAFRSSSDLHLVKGDPFLRGVNSATNVDIDGDKRCVDNPSVGADEATVVSTGDSLQVDVPDTVYLESPFQVQYTGAFNGKVDWYLDGSKKASGFKANLTPLKQGKDTVMMTLSLCGITDTAKREVFVQTPPAGPRAKFFTEKQSVLMFDTVHFQDFSHEGIAGWKWNIKPGRKFFSYRFLGSSTAESQHPKVQFLEPGVYDICLAVFNYDQNGQKRWDTICREDYLEVNDIMRMCNQQRSTDNHNHLFDDGGPDKKYSANQNCSFTINPCTDTVKLTFNSFDLDANGDYLRIYNGTSAQGEKLWDTVQYGDKGLTGQKSDKGFDTNLIATEGAVYVEFESNGSDNRQGFDLEWEGTGNSYSSPKAQIKGKDTICKGFDYTFSAKSQTNNTAHVTHKWYVNDFQSATEGETFTYNPKSGGQDTVYLVTKECELADTSKRIVTVQDPKQINQVAFSADNRTPDIQQDVVTLSNDTKYCGREVEWEISPAEKVQYVNGTNANSPEPQLLFADTGCYDVKLIVKNATTADSLERSCFINAVNYCRPQVTKTNPDIGISFFGLKGVQNESPIGQSRYTNYSGTHETALAKGVTYSAEVKRKTNVHAISRKIWIDFDQDGDFEDPGELVAEQSEDSTITWNPQIDIPKNAKQGMTRLRVGAFIQSGNNACGDAAYGEYEDYGVRIIEDQTPPIIQLDGQDTLKLEACSSLAGKDTGAQAFENRDGSLTSQISVNSQVDTAKPGSYKIHYEVSDQHNNKAEKVRTVIIQPDATQPQISLKGSETYEHVVHETYKDPGYTATDACSGIASIDTVSSVDTNAIGEYEVTYMVMDEAGNQNQVSRTVKVTDTLDPSLKLKGADPYVLQVNNRFEDPGVSYADNYWPKEDLTLEKQGEVKNGKLGNYELTYQVTDASGNGPVKVSREVRVKDTVKPVITPVPEHTLSVEVYNRIGEFDLVANVADNFYDNDEISLQKGGAFYNYFADGKPDSLGLFRAQLAYTDPSGNTDTVSKMVKVIDETAPQIQLKGPSYVTVQRWQETTYVDSFIVQDNYYPSDSITVSKSGSYFDDYIANGYPSGQFEITYKATDASGNSSQRVFRYVQTQNSTGIDGDTQEEPVLNVAPNPTNGRFTLTVNLEKERSIAIEVLDQTGRIVKEVTDTRLKTSDFRVDLSGQAAGLYLLRIQGEGFQKTRKIEVVK